MYVYVSVCSVGHVRRACSERSVCVCVCVCLRVRQGMCVGVRSNPVRVFQMQGLLYRCAHGNNMATRKLMFEGSL